MKRWRKGERDVPKRSLSQAASIAGLLSPVYAGWLACSIYIDPLSWNAGLALKSTCLYLTLLVAGPKSVENVERCSLRRRNRRSMRITEQDSERHSRVVNARTVRLCRDVA